MLHEKELTRGNRNRATLAVARKLVIYMLAVDRRGEPFMTEKESLVAWFEENTLSIPMTFPSGLAVQWTTRVIMLLDI